MISGIGLQIDTDVLDAVAYTANNAPSLMQTAYKRQIQSVVKRLKVRLATYPQNEPEHPFIWSYDPVKQGRARRWYFANKVDKSNPNGRYKRTGGLGRAWQVKADTTSYSGLLAVENNTPGAEYVQGDYQVPSHAINDWPRVDEVIAEFQGIATNEVIDIWFTVVLPESR